MKKFVFTLQAVYDLALSNKKVQQERLRKIESDLTRFIMELNGMKNAYLDAKDNCAADMAKGISSDRLSQYNLYFESLINTMIEQKDKIIRTEKEKERCTQELIKIRTDIKTMEKLRDQQLESYKAEEKKEAENEIGDVVSFKVNTK